MNRPLLVPASFALDHQRLRTAGKDVLSLALIEARNQTLRWAAAIEAAPGGDWLRLSAGLPEAIAAELDPPLWTFGHIGWFQECWIARNVQRSRGENADPRGPRLASILASADAWYDGDVSMARTTKTTRRCTFIASPFSTRRRSSRRWPWRRSRSASIAVWCHAS
jgi:hypothetical protein